MRRVKLDRIVAVDPPHSGQISYRDIKFIFILKNVSLCSLAVRFAMNWGKLTLKGLFTNFEYVIFFSCLNRRNIFYERPISIKQLWLEIIEKIGCSKSVRPSTVIYMFIILYHGLSLSTIFLHYFESELFYRDRPLIQNVPFIKTQKKLFVEFNLIHQLFFRLTSN